MGKSRWLLLAALFVAGCSGGSSSSSSTSTTGAPSSGGAANTLEVQAFKGGYDIDFYQKSADEWAAKNAGWAVKVEGSPKVWETLRPRFISGDVPDLCFPGWGMDHWALKEEDQLMALDEALDGKPYEGDGKWRDTFEPGILKLGQMDGKSWVLPYYYSVLGWWYDPAVFKKNGWSVPKTWDELLSLSEKIKAKGMAPITFQGKYPDYMEAGMLLPWAYSMGGTAVMKSLQNMDPGAWKSPSMLKAAQMIDELNKKGFFQEGATAMTHTEAQTQFVTGKAAMIPCGTWLKAEMANVMPKEAKMEFMLPPVLTFGKGDKGAVLIKIEPWMVPSKAKHPKEAIDLFKYMTSLTKAKQFVEEKGTLMAIKGSDSAKLIPELVEPAKVIKESKEIWSLQFRDWYPEFQKELENALTALLNGTETPESFCDRLEKKAEETRNNADIVKHKVE